MNGNKVKISSRSLLNLLAGNLSFEAFSRDHTFGNTSDNLFNFKVRKGMLLSDIRIEKDPTADDDWVVMEFEQDVAVRPFRSPRDGDKS